MYTTAKTMPVSLPNDSTNCPTCGGKTCFERPRFFGGQLLTDQDLLAAQQYVIEKNKLHNRYLVGTGVACGLMVKCDPCCDGGVVIEKGYAIDGDGNDIVLCQKTSFDVLGYLKKQKLQEDLPYCGHTIYNQKAQPVNDKKEYRLILSYAEEMAKPTTALVRDNGCNTSRCEPSRIRETFRFDLVEARTDKPINIENLGELKMREWIQTLTPEQSFLGQWNACFETLTKIFQSTRTTGTPSSDLNAVFTLFRNAVLEFYRQEPIIRCDLPEEVAAIESQFRAATNDPEKVQAGEKMLALGWRLLFDCLCNALLVQCPDCNEGEGVLLACITVQNNKIAKICNTVRKQLITGPSIQYWLQPLFSSIETLIALGCCDLDVETLQEILYPPSA